MKNIITLTLLLISTLQILFTQNWQWANSAGNIFPYDDVSSMCKDQNGNIYLIGTVQGSLPGISNRFAYFPNDTIAINGMNDLFLTS